MTTIEAYEHTLEKIKELDDGDIIVRVVPHNSRRSAEIRKRYKGNEHIPPDKWVNVNFRFSNREQEQKIREAVNYLSLCGIYFDTGGMGGERDWELDWSFKYAIENDVVKNLINQK